MALYNQKNTIDFHYNTIIVEMITNQNKSILDPYKTIGYFVNGPISSSESLPYTLAVACHNSFKIYSHELSIKVVSPCF